MKAEARLESAVFQLTPTRTRCDLVINSHGKKEKIASGLLKPFLDHLKTAREQIEKGGYSITLEPPPGADAVWFTKGTVERFVRFVSTPEVLERVATIESAIVQIEEAITIQGNENFGLSNVGEPQMRSTENHEGSKRMFDADEEKAIVLYKPGQTGSHLPNSNGSSVPEENSKVQLLRVLETRKTVLQKEQGMAFARAVAAGFDMDQMANLVSFSESFGASRLMDACLRFMELWKAKHESGQWLDIEAADVMSSQSEFSAMNTSGIIMSGDSMKHRAWLEPNGDLAAESNGKPDSQNLTSDHYRDLRLPSDPQVPSGQYFQGQYPTYPQWPMHAPPGPPGFHPYAMPYYQNYAGAGPYFQPPYSSVEDPRFNTPQRMGLRRHSMDSKDSNIESEGVSSARSQDGADQNPSEFEKEERHLGHESNKKGSRSSKRKSGVVVIRNINYITSKKHETSGSDSRSSDSENEANEDLHFEAPHRNHKESSGSLRRRESHGKSIETSDTVNKNDELHGQDADSGNWQVFQSFLLRREEEDKNDADKGMFAGEREPPVKRRQNSNEADPIILHDRDSDNAHALGMVGFDSVDGKARRAKQVGSNDELLISSRGRGLIDIPLDAQLKEIESGFPRYRKGTSDEFMIYEREKNVSSKNSLDPLAENEYKEDGKTEKSTSYSVTDESFMIPYRSGSHDQLGTDSRTAIDMDSELPSALQRTASPSIKDKIQVSYEPDELILLPERGLESESIGYDPAKDYEMQISVKDTKSRDNRDQSVAPSTEQGLKKADKEKTSRVARAGLEKKRMDAVRDKGKLLKSNALVEAQKRAEKLRAFKADLQKEKKEKEEEEIKRLEGLKRERQKRIAARSGINTTTPTQQPISRLPTKVTSSSFKGSKFSDSEHGSSSPLQNLPRRAAHIGSPSSQKSTKSSGLNRSVSSLPDLKKESASVIPESRVVPARMKRLSDPKISNNIRASLQKSVGVEQAAKKSVPDEPQMRKISAIMHLDKTKSATLPELKIKPSRTTLDPMQSKSMKKETLKKGSGSRGSLTSESIPRKKADEDGLRPCDIDDNPVIEKTVVMLENEMVPAPVVESSEETITFIDRSYRKDNREKTENVSEYAAIRAPPSPVIMAEVKEPRGCELEEQSDNYKVVNNVEEDGSQMFSGLMAAERPYQAPYARITSLEDPATTELEHIETPSAIDTGKTTGREDSKVSVENLANLSSIDQVHEGGEKPRSKESSKGFRKLLKFGRKSHSSSTGEHSPGSAGSAVDNTAAAGSSSNDVHLLKNLISQDDTQVTSTPPKVSRPFSILSPFRSKTSSDKKTAEA